jgi:hypothetical protein
VTQPTLTTERLLLRPFALTDGAKVRDLAAARVVADTTPGPSGPLPDGRFGGGSSEA